ncbi:esterase/lipase family protein [Cerasicoccus maritimus]|uniref:esterase/lipase family protein n=1 Tax=Cerasicoccus maritimus TaxID=490089 RepID=UPI0028524F1C|nr:alpha/beta fold hydrolase [Cerasicoccus maritimus]
MRLWLAVLFLPFTLLAEQKTVVVIHGLAASAGVMGHVENTLEADGYRVVNIDYPSMSKTLYLLAKDIRAKIVEETQGVDQIDFVTHSMGGIILRQIQLDDPLPNIGRVVMIAPPNHGSEALDIVASSAWAKMIFGPAGSQLAATNSKRWDAMGPASFEVGIIAGTLGIDPVVSSMIEGPDDGVISVESTKLDGMSDFVTVHETHPMLVFNGEVMDQMVAFLNTGTFLPPQPSEKSQWAGNWTHRR